MRLTVTVPDPVADEAKRLAEVTGRSVSAVVAEAVERHVTAERRRLAAERIDALIGNVEVAADADDVLREMRRASDRELS
jgi:predicted DNA-binding protein